MDESERQKLADTKHAIEAIIHSFRDGQIAALANLLGFCKDNCIEDPEEPSKVFWLDMRTIEREIEERIKELKG